MSNHVHALLLPKISPSRLMQSLKGVTARDANRILCRTGVGFEMKRNGCELRVTSRTIPLRRGL